MSASQTVPGELDDVEVIRACRDEPSRLHWAIFFERFEDRFRQWIASTLRDSPEQDRDDVYQNVVAHILDGEVLVRLDLTTGSKPLGYLFRTVQNLAREAHRHKKQLAEEPLDDGSPVSSHLSRLADHAPPVPENVILRRLMQGIEASGLSPEKIAVFHALIDCQNIAQVIEKTKLSPATVYRHKRELYNLSQKILGRPVEGKKKFRRP